MSFSLKLYNLFYIILTGLLMSVADIQPERLIMEAGRVTHFLVTGSSISMLLRSFLAPMPPTL